MTRRDWYIGIAAIVAALMFHAVFPRYEVREGHWTPVGGQDMIRIDRWTGQSIVTSTRLRR